MQPRASLAFLHLLLPISSKQSNPKNTREGNRWENVDQIKAVSETMLRGRRGRQRRKRRSEGKGEGEMYVKATQKPGGGGERDSVR